MIAPNVYGRIDHGNVVVVASWEAIQRSSELASCSTRSTMDRRGFASGICETNLIMPKL